MEYDIFKGRIIDISFDRDGKSQQFVQSLWVGKMKRCNRV